MRDSKGRFIKNTYGKTYKKYIVTCSCCGIKRRKCYKDWWAIRRGINSNKCFDCTRFKKGETNKGGFKKGILPWNMGKGKATKWERIKKSKEWIEMRKKVFERDKYTCQKCSQIGRTLHAHHIKPKSRFPELVYELTNVITLCKICHKKTDTYGYKAVKKNYDNENHLRNYQTNT